MPIVSSNSATATKIFAKAVLLKTILSEKWCTYSTNRARGPKNSEELCSVYIGGETDHISSASSFKHIEGFVSHLALRSMTFLIGIS